jgi:hypothetical protein
MDRVGESGRVDVVEGVADGEGGVDPLVELAQSVTGLGGPAPPVSVGVGFGVGEVGDGVELAQDVRPAEGVGDGPVGARAAPTRRARRSR